MARLLTEFDSPIALLRPLAPPSGVASASRSSTRHATTLRGLRESAVVGRHDDADVRYVATSGSPALVLENARLIDELHASRLRIVQAAERERRRLEQDLHDGTQQRLVEIQVRLDAARALVDRTDLARQLEAIQQAADAALAELRTLARGIYPPTLRHFGPAAALRALAQGSVVPIKVTDEGIARSSAPIEAAIYFCATEAIQNATKHAGQGARVRVALRRFDGMIELVISDDGMGMSAADATNGSGIVGMRDRIEAVGGEFEIASHAGRGTRVHVTIPDERAAEAGTGCGYAVSQ